MKKLLLLVAVLLFTVSARPSYAVICDENNPFCIQCTNNGGICVQHSTRCFCEA